jgi:excinuclease ABC subunit B
MPLTKEDLARLIRELETQMKRAAKIMDFERAALLRDRIIELKRELIEPEAKPHGKR